MQLDLIESNTGNETRKGRPAKHASAAARKAAYRADKAYVDSPTKPRSGLSTVDTVLLVKIAASAY